SLNDTVWAACLHRLDVAPVRAEVTAQIAAFARAFGRLPDFVDGHQHVHLLPQIREAVLAAVGQIAPAAWVRQCGRVLPVRARFADPKGLCLDLISGSFRARAAQLGIRTNVAFAGTYDF